MNGNADLKVLLVEDSPSDAELVLRALRPLARQVEHARVSCESTLRDALAFFEPDVILSDFSMPSFSGHHALEIVREVSPEIPFLFVSGTIGEESAIESLQLGAMDYVLKDNLRRLPSAVERALRTATERAERDRMQRALEQSEDRFRTIVETSQDWIWENDCSANLTYSNGAITQILGYRPEEVVGTPVTRYMLDEDRVAVESRMPKLVSAREGWRRWRLRWRHRDGSCKVMESTGTPLFHESGKLIGFRGIDHDVTERLQHENKIRQLARIHAVLSAVGNAVLRAADRQALLLNACRVAVEQGGFKAAGIGERGTDGALHVTVTYGDRSVLDVVAPKEPMSLADASEYSEHPSIRAFRENRRIAVQDFAHCDFPPELCRLMLDNGVRSQISLPIGAEPWGLLAIYSDSVLAYDDEEVALLQRLSDEIDYAVDFLAKGERLEYLAFHNPETGLANRISFHEKLRPHLEQGPMIVVALDVPRLGRISSTRGRVFGDRLLRQLGTRLWHEDTLLAHVEAASFLLAYSPSLPIEQEIELLDARLRDIEHCAFLVDDEQIYLSLRGGLAIGPQDGKDGEALEGSAMAALADAGKRDVRLSAYTVDMRRLAMRTIELERDLRRAIENREFELHFQPKYDAVSRMVVGAEALLRWRHPAMGLVSPAEFIPILEETGLIVPVGHWVMRNALATALDWRKRHAPEFRIAVNISARELRHRTYLDKCRALLMPYASDQPLDVEITESVLMDDIGQSVALLKEFRGFGCHVAIDDFGTGYSSLNYLVKLPIDTIKIDQSFVAMLTTSPETLALTTNVISLAHSLGLSVVAEGVEDEEQAKLLQLLRCDVLQGYLLGRPMPAETFLANVFAGKFDVP